MTVLVAGCEIPPVDPTYISDTPADAASFRVAQSAVRACSNLKNRSELRRKFQRAGFSIREERVKTRDGEVSRFYITAPDPAVHVIYLGSSCYVGLEKMTPEQSAQLAQIWVRAHRAQPNSAFGDGLSDHVSGAWRRFFDEPAKAPTKAAYRHRIYIGAYKTWPYGPYDPQRDVGYKLPTTFPKTKGAAVALSHTSICEPSWYVQSATNQFYLPCSGPAYRPK